jgi:hypothetical protein
MKTVFRRIMLIWAIPVLSFIICDNVCLGIDQESIIMLDKQVLQVEDIWKTKNIHEYYLKATNIAKDIMINSPTSNLNTIAAKFFDNLISKEVKIEEVELDDLLVMKKMASYLISNINASVEERQINVKLLCKYLGKMRKEVVPNYTPKLVVANVAQPAGTPGAAGMSPEAISDPIARAKYEASIRENQGNSRMNSRQVELRSIEWEMSKPIIAYTIGTFHASDISSALFTECINSASFNDREKEEIVSKVGLR